MILLLRGVNHLTFEGQGVSDFEKKINVSRFVPKKISDSLPLPKRNSVCGSIDFEISLIFL